jgi:hypothetical protein
VVREGDSSTAAELEEVRNQRRVSLGPPTKEEDGRPVDNPTAAAELASELQEVSSVRRTSRTTRAATAAGEEELARQRLQKELAGELRDLSARRAVQQSRLLAQTAAGDLASRRPPASLHLDEELSAVSSHRRVNQIKDALITEQEQRQQQAGAKISFTTYKEYNPPPNKSEKMRQTIEMFDKGQKDTAGNVAFPAESAAAVTNAEMPATKVHEMTEVFSMRRATAVGAYTPDIFTTVKPHFTPEMFSPCQVASTFPESPVGRARLASPNRQTEAKKAQPIVSIRGQPKDELRSSRLSLYILEDDVILNKVKECRAEAAAFGKLDIRLLSEGMGRRAESSKGEVSAISLSEVVEEKQEKTTGDKKEDEKRPREECPTQERPKAEVERVNGLGALEPQENHPENSADGAYEREEESATFESNNRECPSSQRLDENSAEAEKLEGRDLKSRNNEESSEMAPEAESNMKAPQGSGDPASSQLPPLEESPEEEDTAPAKEEAATAKEEAAPAKEEHGPAKEEVVQAKEEASPAKEDGVSAKEGPGPAKEESASSKELATPSDKVSATYVPDCCGPETIHTYVCKLALPRCFM